MSAKLKAVDNDRPSSVSGGHAFVDKLDDLIVNNIIDISPGEVVDFTTLIGRDLYAFLMDLEKEYLYRRAITAMIRGGEINLECAGKDDNGEDLYRVT